VQVRWSPDSSQILYSMSEATPDDYSVHVRKVATGEDREIYRSKGPTLCNWASHHASVFCGHRTPQDRLEVLSIALDSGRVEQLGSIAGYPSGTGTIYFASDDDRAIYLQRGTELIRWEFGAEQATTVEQMPGMEDGKVGVPFPDTHWIGRSVNGVIEIRPFAGGDWKPITNANHSYMPVRPRTVFTPDGKWLLYFEPGVSGKETVFRISTAGGKPEKIGDFAGSSGSKWISPDGRSLITLAFVAPEAWVLENFEPKAPSSR